MQDYNERLTFKWRHEQRQCHFKVTQETMKHKWKLPKLSLFIFTCHLWKMAPFLYKRLFLLPRSETSGVLAERGAATRQGQSSAKQDRVLVTMRRVLCTCSAKPHNTFSKATRAMSQTWPSKPWIRHQKDWTISPKAQTVYLYLTKPNRPLYTGDSRYPNLITKIWFIRKI